MNADQPDARGLIEIALKTFREVVLPAVPPEQRFPALMIANALSIAGRELGSGGDAALAEPLRRLLGGDGGMDALCARIAAGDFDRSAELRAFLWELTRARLAVSNPKYLAR